jgi:hypothetical protein
MNDDDVSKGVYCVVLSSLVRELPIRIQFLVTVGLLLPYLSR